MENNELQIKLYDRMFSEQDSFREWLLGLPKEEILYHTYEFTAKDDMLYFIDDTELSGGEYNALLSVPAPLDEIYKTYVSHDSAIFMDGIRQAVKCTAEKPLKKEGEKLNEQNEGCYA